MTPPQDIVKDLESRALVTQLAGGDDLKAHLAEASRVVYCGFDPTAESLHIGNMVPLLALKPVPEAGWFGRTYDTLKLWVR